MKNPNFTFKSSYSSNKFFPFAVCALFFFLFSTQIIQAQSKLDASSLNISTHKIGSNDLNWNMRFSDKSNSDFMFTELSIGPSVQITQPNCIQTNGTIKITAPLDPNFSYSIDGNSYQSGAIFTHLTPGNYPVTTKDNIGVVSDITWITINAPPSNCNADIFHTTEDCNDFKNGDDSSRLNQLCYTINSNKIFNVTPGQFFYFTSLVAPSTSFTITVNQSSNITNFPLFSINKDQIILWSDTCTKFITGTEVSNGQVEVNVTNAIVGKTYVLSVKYDSKSIIGNTITGEPIPEYSFNTYIDDILVNNSTTSIFMYPNNCVSQGLASIGDLVWNDLDNDGIQDDFEPGIITTVRLFTCSDQLVATITSAEDGSYSFKDLQPGTYYLQFDLPQNFFFSPKDQGTDDAKDNDVDVITGKTNCITLIAGENNTTIDCGIDPPVSLGDFVWNDLNGDGIQDVGETGIANVVVKLYDCNESLIASTTTNSEGYYIFETIPPGSYYVEFTIPEGYEFSPKDQSGIESTDSDADPTTGRSVCQTLIFGQTDTWNDAGMYIPASIGNFVWKDFNGNGIQDIDEPGFSNITVKLYTCGDVLIGSTTTATDGSYLFEHLSPGSYYIQVDLPLGFKFSPSNIGSNNTIDSDIDPTSYKSSCVTVLSGDINPILDAGIECVPPDAPSFSLIQPSCTLATGTITITQPLGSDLVYSIDGTNFQSDVAFSGLSTGTYQVTVKNTYSCVSDPFSAVLDPQPPTPLAATVSIIQPNCTLATGTITITQPLGSDLVYSIDGTNFQSDVAFSGLSTGTYQVTVKNTYSCVSDPFSAVLDPQPPTPLAATVSIIQPNCTLATGTITITQPLGSDLVYSIDGTNFQSDVAFSGLSTGTYQVTVKNTYSCVSDPFSAVLDPQPPTPLAATVSIIQPNCTLATGTITITQPLGSDLVYSIDGTNFQSDVAFSGLSTGTYQVTVKNTYSCVSDPFSAVLDPQPPTPVAATVSIIQPNCIVPRGTITINSPLANSFTYSLDNVNYQSGTIFSYKLPGSYNITVKNMYGCISVPTIVEVKPQPNCGANIFNTTATCNDFKYAITGKLHDRLCYTIKSNKIFNVTPGMFFYYTLITAPASSFTINVDQSVNNSAFRLFSVLKDQIILWNDACVKFTVGKETITGQVQINVTGATNGNIYILSVKYDSKSIIGGAVSGAPIPSYAFSSRINTLLAPNSTTSISMYPNNCNLPNTESLLSNVMEVGDKEGNLQLYPNPNTGICTLTIKGFRTGKALINVVDIYGKILLTKEALLTNETTLLPLNLPGEITNGIYFVLVTQNNDRKTIRLLKQ